MNTPNVLILLACCCVATAQCKGGSPIDQIIIIRNTNTQIPNPLELASFFPASYKCLMLTNSPDFVACVLRSPSGMMHIYAAMKVDGTGKWQPLTSYIDEYVDKLGNEILTARPPLGKYLPDLSPIRKESSKRGFVEITRHNSAGFTTREGPLEWPPNSAAIRLRFREINPQTTKKATVFSLLIHKTLF